MTEKTNIEQFLEDSRKFNQGLGALKVVLDEVLFLYDKIMSHGQSLTAEDLQTIKKNESQKTVDESSESVVEALNFDKEETNGE